ncbi:hypothetical protein [Nonomuraea sp. NPDC049695]
MRTILAAAAKAAKSDLVVAPVNMRPPSCTFWGSASSQAKV